MLLLRITVSPVVHDIGGNSSTLGGTHHPRFQYVPSKPWSNGDGVWAGTVISKARIARVMPTNMVRRSVARNSSRSSTPTFAGPFPYHPLLIKPDKATMGNSSPFAELSVSTFTPGLDRFNSCPDMKLA